MGFDTILWILAILAFGVAEALTTALISVWFVVGSVAALIVSLITDSFTAQLLTFAVVSAIALAIMIPALKKRATNGDHPPVTNGAPLSIGKQGVVIKAIAPGKPGRVRVDGLDWQASADEDLPEGTDITVTDVADGATLLVRSMVAV